MQSCWDHKAWEVQTDYGSECIALVPSHSVWPASVMEFKRKMKRLLETNFLNFAMASGARIPSLDEAFNARFVCVSGKGWEHERHVWLGQPTALSSSDRGMYNTINMWSRRLEQIWIPGCALLRERDEERKHCNAVSHCFCNIHEMALVTLCHLSLMLEGKNKL